MKGHLNIKIYGLVQGVFFRHSAQKEAEKLGLKGFARNEPDGAVYLEAEGEEKDLEKFLEWCRKGPPLAQVQKVESGFSRELKNFKEFTIE